ncbi:hydroquinone glucosyltransferase [Trifolium repens]|nr:hydroquinone glucosyltransferase [Trifolium repens]
MYRSHTWFSPKFLKNHPSKSSIKYQPDNHTFLPPVQPNDLPQGLPLQMKIQLTVTHFLPYLHQALKSFTSRTPLVSLLVDSFAVEALDFSKEFNMLSYIYYPVAATTLADEETSCEYIDLPEPIKIPGCVHSMVRIFLSQLKIDQVKLTNTSTL